MRFLTTVLLWLVTTVLLTVTIPATWAQRNLIDAGGYAALAAHAASDPAVQQAVAAELSTQAMRLIRQRGYTADAERIHEVAAAYTAGPAFPAAFARANELGHGWLFGDGWSGSDPWVVDVAPMLGDGAFAQTLSDYGVRLPSAVTVPMTATNSDGPQPGRLHPLSVWGPWAVAGLVVLTGACVVLTLVTTRSRGRTLTALGVSALLAGAAGWAGIEIGRGYLGGVLNRTTVDMRLIAEGVVDSAVADLHHWLNLTLAAGGALIVFGVIVAMLGGLARLR
ncbi:MAG TPA: hypothetical protein VFR17_09210 [Mycobacterium sp.]|nr:hypothetical protein [Mycobacterium sp.]